MQELANAINNSADNEGLLDGEPLEDAAVRWAEYVLCDRGNVSIDDVLSKLSELAEYPEM